MVLDFGDLSALVRGAVIERLEMLGPSADAFIVDEDNVVIVSRDGWVKRQKEVKDLSTTRLREGDAVLAALGGGLLAVASLPILVLNAARQGTAFDVVAASARGIYVANCPGKNSVAVAELAFGMILALDRRIPDNVADLRAGRWNKKEYSKSRGLHGRTLGLLGFGNIGQEMAKRAQAFGMNLAVVLTWADRRQGAMINDRVGPNRAVAWLQAGRCQTALGMGGRARESDEPSDQEEHT